MTTIPTTRTRTAHRRSPISTRVDDRKPGRKPPPPGETPHDRFVRIGTRRMNKVLDAIRLLGNLANDNYRFSSEEIEKIETALQEAITKTMGRFQPKVRAEGDENFRFD